MADIISLILTAKNDASKVIKQVQSDTKAMQKEVGKNGASNIDPMANMVGNIAGVVAASLAIRELGQAMMDASKAAGELERLETGMDNLAAKYGSSSKDILSSIQSVTQGTLDNKTIMQQANNAMLLGVADSAEEFSTLAKIAMVRGRAMGISMEYAFESIVKGVGRLSPLILDNLGIVIDADNTYAQYAETLGKTADSLTDLEKRQALLSKLKGEVANFDYSTVVDSAAAWEQLTASITNATAAFGGWLNKQDWFLGTVKQVAFEIDALGIALNGTGEDKLALRMRFLRKEIAETEDLLVEMRTGAGIEFLVNFLTNGLAEGGSKNALADMRKELEELETIALRAKTAIVVSGAGGGAGQFGPIIEDAAYQAKKLREETGLATEEISRYAEVMGVSKDRAEENVRNIIKIHGSYEAAIPSILAIINNQEILNQKARDFQNIMGSAVGSLQSQILDAFANTGYDPAILELGQARIDQLTEFGTTLDVNGNSLLQTQAAMRQASDSAGEFFVSINDAAKATGSATKATKQLTEAYSALNSLVGSAVGDALNDFGGASIEDYLPGGGDNVDAPSRRIADVMVKGFNSPWVDYFKNTFPELFTTYMAAAGGDIQKASAKLLSDYNKGMVPQLIDRNNLKEIIKQQYRADGEIAAYIDQLAQEIAGEMGISIEEATALAGGAVGGKAGKAKVDDFDLQKELNKINSLKPTLNFGDWSEGFILSGKESGLMDDSGAIKLPVKFDTSGGSLADAIMGGGPGLGGLKMAVPTDAGDSIKEQVGTVQIATVPTMEESTAKAALEAAGVTVSVMPTISDDELTAYTELLKTTIQANLKVVPSLVFDTEAILTSVGLVKNAIGNGIVDPDYINAIGTVFTSGLGSALVSQSVSFGIMGVQTGAFIYQGFVEYNLGAVLASELSRQLGEAQKSFESSANNAGKVWGNAFLDVVGKNVPFELLLVLTDLITPEVVKRVKEEKDRGGGE